MPEYTRKMPHWVRSQAVEAAYLVLYNEHKVTRRQVIAQLDRWERRDRPDAAEWELWAGKAWLYFDAVMDMMARNELIPPGEPRNG